MNVKELLHSLGTNGIKYHDVCFMLQDEVVAIYELNDSYPAGGTGKLISLIYIKTNTGIKIIYLYLKGKDMFYINNVMKMHTPNICSRVLADRNKLAMVDEKLYEIALAEILIEDL